MSKLAGRTAIITGSGRGIGQAIAMKLGSEGANVVINDLDEIPAIETLAMLRAAGINAHAVVGDVAAADFPEQILTEALTSFGGLDIIVNNAGYIWNTAIQNTTDEQWAAMIDVHASAPFRLLRAAAGYFRETAKAEAAEFGRARTRKIVNISSVSGLHGAATQVAYAAGKAAMVGVTKTLAKEWGRYNITVNCVAFGHIETRLTQPLTEGPKTIDVHGMALKVGLNPAMIEASRTTTALQRPGTPEDAAGSVYLLCIPESDYITGHILECSGGIAGG
jgi:3-oxoacyl-[acyl-carrier protein] reductase